MRAIRILLSGLFFFMAGDAHAGLRPDALDWNQFELVGISSTHLALKEYYSAEVPHEINLADDNNLEEFCLYEGLKGKTIDISMGPSHKGMIIAATGLIVHEVPYKPGDVSKLTMGTSEQVYLSTAARPVNSCTKEKVAQRKLRKFENRIKDHAGKPGQPPDWTKQTIPFFIDPSLCLGKKSQTKQCSFSKDIRVGEKTFRLQLNAFSDIMGWREEDGEPVLEHGSELQLTVQGFLTLNKGEPIPFAFSYEGASFSLMPFDVIETDQGAVFIFRISNVFLSNRLITPYFLVVR